VRIHISTEYASDRDLLDRILDKGIVVEVWDQVGLPNIDMTGMHVTISLLQLFHKGINPPAPTGYFWKVDAL